MLDRRSSRSFSPLFVGAVVAMQAGRVTREGRTGFSPLFVGAGVAIELPGWLVMHWRVSVPYLSGQALQFCRGIASPPSRRFQSPICRGRRCNRRQVSGSTAVWCFSPLFVGAGVAIAREPGEEEALCGFSPLFVGAVVAIAWPRSKRCCSRRFSPLFVGAVVAIPKHFKGGTYHGMFQSPIRRGSRCNAGVTGVRLVGATFQSPIRRGSRCNLRTISLRTSLVGWFQSPICRGRRCNVSDDLLVAVLLEFQSPICRGRRCNLRGGEFTAPLHAFQSPICRGRRCNNPMVPCARPTCSRFQSPICRGRRCNSTKRG